jgi:RNA polymerase sigma factor (sigma-70 family)
MSREQLFLSQLALIKRVVAWTCGRHGLRGADAEDFASYVNLRFIKNDYEVLAKFEGRCSLQTYLTTVVQNFFRDFQNERFGKFRNSAKAKRLGPLAVRLERLLYRDGLAFDEAFATLTSEGWTDFTRDSLYALSRVLPQKVNRKPAAAAVPETAFHPADPIEQRERQELGDRVFCVLRRSLARLPAGDRLLLRHVFEESWTVANLAKAWKAEQKGLYRRRDAALAELRADFLREGISAKNVQELLETLDWDAALTMKPMDDVGPFPPQPPAAPPPGPAKGEGEKGGQS